MTTSAAIPDPGHPTSDEVLLVARGIATAAAPPDRARQRPGRAAPGHHPRLTGELVEYTDLEPVDAPGLDPALAARWRAFAGMSDAQREWAEAGAGTSADR